MVDLNTCNEGDILICRDGKIVLYSKKLNSSIDYYEHEIKYVNGSWGTRMNNGRFFNNFKFEPEDIIQILYLNPKKYLIHGT